jgi:outer membrane protein, heavy metal efflux system
MSLRRAAIFAAIASFGGLALAQTPRELTLDAAFARTLDKHPELARFAQRRDAALADVDASGQRPALRLDLEVENAFQSAETTLSLASAFERGDKRGARLAVATAGLDALSVEQEQRRADLLAEVARRYLDLVATQSLADIAEREIGQREAGLDAATRRVQAGASPESVRLAAAAALARAKQVRGRQRAEARGAALRLGILWGAREPEFDRAIGEPLSIPATPSLDELRKLIQGNPDLRRFADESRLREARVQLARSARVADVEWRVGVRRLDAEGGWAAVAGVSMPIGSGKRSEPGVRSARAELAALALDREIESLTLEATLIDAHVRFESAATDARTLGDTVLPSFEAAERAAERAFRAGALTYTEWSQLQSDTLAARREQLDAAIDAHRALIEIQRLTGSPFGQEASPAARTSP